MYLLWSHKVCEIAKALSLLRLRRVPNEPPRGLFVEVVALVADKELSKRYKWWCGCQDQSVGVSVGCRVRSTRTLYTQGPPQRLWSRGRGDAMLNVGVGVRAYARGSGTRVFELLRTAVGTGPTDAGAGVCLWARVRAHTRTHAHTYTRARSQPPA